MKLDLGCGQNTTEGFDGVDLKPGKNVKYTFDLFAGKRWPFKNNSVDEVISNHLVEHIPHYRPEYRGIDGWWVFFNELYRVCKSDATLTFNHPQAQNQRAYWDPTHTRYLTPTTWYYLTKAWREAQRLDHYDAKCDFEVIVINAPIADSLATRHHEAQDFGRNHYWDALGDLTVQLKTLK